MPEKKHLTRQVSLMAQPPGPSGAGWSADILNLYTERAVLGEGGKGRVYLLENKSTGRRFAVKRVIGLEQELKRDFLSEQKTRAMTKGSTRENLRREFLTELQTWIDLPEHPNLVTCRSFMAGDEVLIFADYVEGGSLQKWMDSKQLYEGGDKVALKRILDVAIQSAWGLHCLHELGIIHQDVKPANLMISNEADGARRNIRVKVADYGVARVGAASSVCGESGQDNKIPVICGALTEGYASPEQLEPLFKRNLDWRTDLWSWGMSVFEMFYGRLPSKKPGEAPQKLLAFLEHEPGSSSEIQIPAAIVTILRSCFQEDPSQRWKSFAVVINRLKNVFREVTGEEYLNELKPIAIPDSAYSGISDRRTRDGRGWRNPKAALLLALQEAGRPNDALGEVRGQPWRKRGGQLAADIAVFDEARAIIESLIQAGRKELRKTLAELCVETSLVLETAEDHYTALNLYEKAAEIYEQLVGKEGHADYLAELAKVYLYWGHALGELGFVHGSINYCAKAVEIYGRLVNEEKRMELSSALAQSYYYLAEARGDTESKLELCDKAISIHKLLAEKENRKGFYYDLGKDFLCKASALLSPDPEAAAANNFALVLLNKAIIILERLVLAEKRREFRPELANAYGHKARVLRYLGDGDGALPFCDKSMELYDQLVDTEGRSEFFRDFAMSSLQKALVLTLLQRDEDALPFYNKAVEGLERLVIVDGRSRFAADLSTGYYYKALRLKGSAAAELFDKSAAILERHVNVEKRNQFSRRLATIYCVSARRASYSPIPLFDKAIAILEGLAVAENNISCATDLARVYRYKAEASGRQGAAEIYAKAIPLLERLTAGGKDSGLLSELDKLRKSRDSALSETDYWGNHGL
ncbi:MAG: hypothetical protein A2049_01765 [Elusimicrobia bacterium GWA2_62_23]|nr:MAG: hypothetical protein A2049_01765 [Elusimicrobia bacterium GWA2_62_23]